MTDFVRIHQHPLVRTRAAVQADFERLGYRFMIPEMSTGVRPGRPRSVGESEDGRARVELIGPQEAAFKATIMVETPLRSELIDFLNVMTPDWADRESWISTQLHTLPAPASAETHYEDFLVTLRAARAGEQIVLGVTWQPAPGEPPR